MLVYGIYNIESFVVYEVYCDWFVCDLFGCENYNFVCKEWFICVENWIFLCCVLYIDGV